MTASKVTEFGDVGKLILVIGDLNVPQYAAKLPPCFSELLATDKIDSVLCTGNIGSMSMYDMLKGICRTLVAVLGDSEDESVAKLIKNEACVVRIGTFKVGLLHGHQVVPAGNVTALDIWQRRLDCDILVYGHANHTQITQSRNCYYLCPGSATGSFDVHSRPTTPSFMLIAVGTDSLAVYIYEENEGKATVVMSELHKHKVFNPPVAATAQGEKEASEDHDKKVDSWNESIKQHGEPTIPPFDTVQTVSVGLDVTDNF